MQEEVGEHVEELAPLEDVPAGLEQGDAGTGTNVDAEQAPDVISSYTAASPEDQAALNAAAEPAAAAQDAANPPATSIRPASASASAEASQATPAAAPAPASRPTSSSKPATPPPAVPAASTPPRTPTTTAAEAHSSPAAAAPADSMAALSVSGSRPGSIGGSQAAPAPVRQPSQGSRPASTSPASKAATPPVSKPGTPPSSSPASPSPPAASSRPPSQPVGSRPQSQGLGAGADAATAGKLAEAVQAGYVAPGLRVIDVQVVQGPGLPHRMLRVLLDYNQQESKAYLGGFRHKQSGVVFHHAQTQTPKAPRYAGVEPKLERQTQTVKVATRSQQSVREAGTQMERPGVLVDTTYDREYTPGRYQTSEERLAIVTAATRTIQRWWRGYLGRKRAAYLRARKHEREAFLRDEEGKAVAAAEEQRRKEIERRMHPRTAADFEILYNELEAWRLQETRKIKEAGLPEDKQQEVLAQLLHKETKLLQTIDRLKINANHENKDTRIQRTLGQMSQPKKYELKNGGKVEVHTPFTTRAKELMQLYNGLNLPLLTLDERLDVLLHVKWTVKEFDCNLTREIVELIDREADLLNRGRNPKMLEGLRKRISSLFLTFLETPEFNPEAASHQVVPMDFENYLFDKLGRSSPRSAPVTSKTSKWDF